MAPYGPGGTMAADEAGPMETPVTQREDVAGRHTQAQCDHRKGSTRENHVSNAAWSELTSCARHSHKTGARKPSSRQQSA